MPPFHGSYWDLPSVTPALNGTAKTAVILGDKYNAHPLFSSADQVMLTNKCVGQLQFLRPLKKAKLIMTRNPGSNSVNILTPHKSWVMTHQPGNTCNGAAGDNLQVNFQVGGTGAGSKEMGYDHDYMRNGSHFLGTYEPGIGPRGSGIYCIKPGALTTVGLESTPGGFVDGLIAHKVGLKAYPLQDINSTRYFQVLFETQLVGVLSKAHSFASLVARLVARQSINSSVVRYLSSPTLLVPATHRARSLVIFPLWTVSMQTFSRASAN